MPDNQGTAAAQDNTQIVVPEATPYIIYVTATSEPQVTESKPNPSISNELLNGKVVYSKFLSHDPVDIQIFVMNLNDGVEKQITNNGLSTHPQWSPDGTKILYSSASEGTAFDIFIMDEYGNNAYPIVSTPGMDINAVWSSDGKMLAYNSDADGNQEIYTINVETKETKQITSDDTGYHGAPSWSPDGKKLVYVYGDGVQYGTHLMTCDLQSGVSEEINSDKFYVDDMPAWSADGQQIVFSRNYGDFNRIFVYDLNHMEENPLTGDLFPGENMEYQVEKSAHGNFISFSVNGKFYVMNMDEQFVYPLGVDALDLHYYPQ